MRMSILYFYEVSYCLNRVNFMIWQYIIYDQKNTAYLSIITHFKLAQVSNQVPKIAVYFEVFIHNNTLLYPIRFFQFIYFLFLPTI